MAPIIRPRPLQVAPLVAPRVAAPNVSTAAPSTRRRSASTAQRVTKARSRPNASIAAAVLVLKAQNASTAAPEGR